MKIKTIAHNIPQTIHLIKARNKINKEELFEDNVVENKYTKNSS